MVLPALAKTTRLTPPAHARRDDIERATHRRFEDLIPIVIVLRFGGEMKDHVHAFASSADGIQISYAGLGMARNAGERAPAEATTEVVAVSQARDDELPDQAARARDKNLGRADIWRRLCD